MIDYRAEIERLYRHHFGDTSELAARLLGTLIGAGFTYAHSGWIGAWAWPLGVFAMHAIQYAHYQSILGRGEGGAYLVTVILCQLSFLAFLWMPVWMISGQDELLQFCGFAVVGATIIYLVHTADRSRVMIWGHVAIMAGATMLAYQHVFQGESNWMSKAGLLFAAAAFLYYFASRLFAARARRESSDNMAQRIAQTQKMEAIGQLAGGVAHDFNNKLTVIIGNLDLFDAIEDPSERKAFIAEAREAAQNGQRVVEQLMQFSRLGPITPERHSNAELLKQVERLRPHLIPDTVLIDFQVPEQPHWVRVDASLFSRTIIQLALNASDAIDKRGRVVIATKRVVFPEGVSTLVGKTLPEGAYVAFSVTDTGPGIPPELLSRVAEPFYTTKSTGDGSGLGLASANGFAESSGGGLVIDTSPRGTTATIFLPNLPATEEVPSRKSDAKNPEPEDDLPGPADISAPSSGIAPGTSPLPHGLLTRVSPR